MNVKEFASGVKKKEIDVVENTAKVIEQIKKINKDYNYFNEISEELAIKQAKAVAKNPKGKLAGVPVSVKDCICVKDVESRAGSKILSGYKPVFNATAVEKVIKEGGIIVGKTSQDAFGFGGFSVNVGLDREVPLNPFDKTRSCGGSSGGSGGITQKADFVHVSLGESTGGSIVAPASYCGVIGLCPTYGRVSRYGLMDYANSLDKIGPMSKSVGDSALMLGVIAGEDKNESTSLNAPVDKYESYVGKDIKGMKVGVVKELLGLGVDDSVKAAVENTVERLKSLGVKVDEVSLPTASAYGIETYYILAMCEASTNLAKYCGMRYGAAGKLEGGFNEYFSKVRSDNFNAESKRRIIIGTFARMAGFRDAYYLKAAKVRTKIIEEYKKLFGKYDSLLSPTMPVLAPKFDEIKGLTPLQNYMMDSMTASPNLAGMPHLNVPVGFSGDLPIGGLFVSDHLQEGKLVQIGSALEVEE